MTPGQRIRERRTELAITQEQLADMVGYSHKSSINKIETDQAGISQKKIAALAKALGVTPDYFFYGSEEKNVEIVMDALDEENKVKLLSYYNFLLEQQRRDK